MKNSLYLAGAALIAVVSLVACDKDTEGVTSVTYYATLELKGSDKMVVTAGQPFNDPGYSAQLEGQDVTSQVVVSSDLDTNVPGLYTVTYSITNADGFSSSASRSVLVTDADDPVAGFYTVSTDSYRDYGGETYYGGYPLTVVGDGQGNYEIDDLLGGWYAYRAAYGSAYAMWGQLTLEADNTLELVDSFVPGWGDAAESFSGSFDPSTSTLSWVVVYTDTPLIFHVNATKD